MKIDVLCNQNPVSYFKSQCIAAQEAKDVPLCQHTVLNDGLDDSKKGKSRSLAVVCCLQPQGWSILCEYNGEYC